MRIAVLAAPESIHSWRWVRFFAERGHEMHWISFTPFTAPVPRNVSTYVVTPFPRGPLSLLLTTARVRRILGRVAPDLLHAHYLGRWGLVGALTRFHPFVATAWGSDVLIVAKSAVMRPLVKYVLHCADVVTCDALHMRDAMVRLGTEAGRIEIVFFGTDTEKFRPGLDGSAFRRRFVADSAPLILSTRSLEPVYDIPTLLRAMLLVLRQVPEARCVIVGRGGERERLEAMARDLGLEGRATFVGAVTGEEMPLCLAAADIYVSTALSDAGLASSTAEAMASELPVVVSDSAENSAWVAEGKGGFVVRCGDEKAFAEKIVYLAGRPESRRALGAYSRKVIVERNNFAVEMGKIERLYQQVIAASAAG